MDQGRRFSVGLAIVVSALSWLITTTWSEYSRRPIVSYELSFQGKNIFLTLKNESFLNETGLIEVGLFCIENDCLARTATADYLTVGHSAPYGAIEIGEIQGAANAQTIGVNLAPRSAIQIAGRFTDTQNVATTPISFLYNPKSRPEGDKLGHVLLIERGLTSYVLGNFPTILITAAIAAVLLLIASFVWPLGGRQKVLTGSQETEA